MDKLDYLTEDLKLLANNEKALFYPRFFKNPQDIFIGVTVPGCRGIAKKYNDLSFTQIKKLLESKIHEERLVGLFVLVKLFKTDPDKVFNFYLKNTKYINNWDLVDLSCYQITGEYLIDKNRDILYKLAKSKLIWERRIAIVSTMAFIRKNDTQDTYKIAKLLLLDKEDLIHKAVGWLLREAGKKDPKLLLNFLRKHYQNIPRTTLRYAIEKFDFDTREKILKNKF